MALILLAHGHHFRVVENAATVAERYEKAVDENPSLFEVTGGKGVSERP
jgi:hypothetical protein